MQDYYQIAAFWFKLLLTKLQTSFHVIHLLDLKFLRAVDNLQ